MFALLLACHSPTDKATPDPEDSAAEQDSGGGEEGGAEGGEEGGEEGGADGSAPERLEMLIYTFDGVTGSAVEGATVELDGDAQTSDSEGHSLFEVEPGGSAYVHAFLGEEYMTSRALLAWDDQSFDAGVNMVTHTTAGLIGSLFGYTMDPAKAVLIVSVLGTAEPATPLAGASVSIDQPYAFVITQDASAGIGYSAGSTTTGDGYGSVIFGLVDPGTVQISIDTEDGRSCTTFSSTAQPITSMELEANMVNQISFYCL